MKPSQHEEEKLHRFKQHWLEIRNEGFKVLTELLLRIQGFRDVMQCLWVSGVQHWEAPWCL